MSHRKKAVVLLLGILVTIVLFLFFQALFMPKYMESMKEGALIAEYDKDSLNHEVVFIGDCEVYENFSPVTLWENYGITSFIRGSASQTIWQSYYLLKDTLRKEKPEVVKAMNVIEPEYVIKMLEELPNDLLSFVITQMDTEKFTEILMDRFPEVLAEIIMK